MPNAPGYILDGSPGFGSRVLTLSGYGPILAENIQFSRPTQEAHDQKSDGEPNRSRYTQGHVALTCTLQAASGTTFPKGGETFTDTFDDNYGAETFVMLYPNVGYTNDATQLRKIAVEFRKVYVAITTVATPSS